MDFETLLNDAFMRYAGDTPLPGELDTLRNLLLRGQIRDEEGNSVVITPQGGFEITPAKSRFNVRGSFGYDPSIYVNYQSRRPEFTGRSPETAIDEALDKLRQPY